MRQAVTGPRGLGEPAGAGALPASPGGSCTVSAQAAARRAAARRAPAQASAGTAARHSARCSRQVITEWRRINLQRQGWMFGAIKQRTNITVYITPLVWDRSM